MYFLYKLQKAIFNDIYKKPIYMEIHFEIREEKNAAIATLSTEGIILNDAQDALDILANCSYGGATKIIIREEQMNADFFDLKTKLAGEVLQKFSNYRCQLAIVGDFKKYESKSLNDFIYESNKSGRIFFASTEKEAIAFLVKH